MIEKNSCKFGNNGLLEHLFLLLLKNHNNDVLYLNIYELFYKLFTLLNSLKPILMTSILLFM